MGANGPIVQEQHTLENMGGRGLGYEWDLQPRPEKHASPTSSGLSRTYLDDVIGERVPEHPVQGDALIFQNVLLGSENQTSALQTPPEEECKHPAAINGRTGQNFYSSATALPHSHFTDGINKDQKEREACLGSEPGLDPGFLTPLCPLTCRLPRGQYSVRIQMFGGSVQAPTNLVRCSFCISRICRWEPASGA